MMQALWIEYCTNGKPKHLRDRLCRLNDGLATKIAHRCSANCPEPIEDLKQIARMGLIKAIERFEVSNGAAFSSFAVPYIRGEIQHYLRDKWGHLKIPRRSFEFVSKVRKTQRQLEASGISISEERIAAYYGMSRDRWQWTLQAVQRKPLVSLDQVSLPDEEADSENDVDRERLRAELPQAIAFLPRLAREFVLEYYFHGMSEESIAKKYKCSVLVVTEKIKEAVSSLRSILEDYEVA